MTDQDEDVIRERLGEPIAPTDLCREQMWQAISRAWDEQAAGRRRARAMRAWGGTGLAAAAMLVLGVIIGRSWDAGVPFDDGRGAAPLSADGAEVLPAPYRVAVGEHFQEAETLLMLFRSADEADAELARLARELGAMTRLLMDSRAGGDAEVRAMLLDLELLLAQIARVVDARDASERELARESIETSAALPRLRQLIAEQAGPSGI